VANASDWFLRGFFYGNWIEGGRSPYWLKMKNPASSAVRREAEEDWGR
jgi:hypothetical protein